MGTPPELIAELEAQARAAEADPGFPRPLVERVRSATRWLGVGGSDGADVRHAAMRLRRQAGIDLE
ncbi:MAG: hypothetical protein ACRDY7_06930, partial [Acidimicrobiia bacterium]